jgi:uncharacterized delta-60 repeat protein
MSKKFVTWLLLALAITLLALPLAACGGDAPPEPTATTPPPATTEPEKPTTEPEKPAPETPAVAAGWNLAIGGERDDRAAAITATSDGGYVLAGHTNSYGSGGYDVYLVKINDAGEVIWTQTYGGDQSDYAYSVTETADGGLIVGGITYSTGAGRFDFYLMKTDADGTLAWEKTYGGADDDQMRKVIQTADGGYLLTGYSNSFGAGWSDIYLIKTDAEGSELWNKTFGGTDHDRAHTALELADGSLVIAGYTVSFTSGQKESADTWLIKLDSGGNEIWKNTMGTTDTDYPYDLKLTDDGGFIIAGYHVSFGITQRDVYLIRADADGKELWFKGYSGAETETTERSASVHITPDGDYLVAGHTLSTGAGASDAWLLKIDPQGEVIWSQTFGGAKDERAYAMLPTADGAVILAGYTASAGNGGADVYVQKITDVVGATAINSQITDAVTQTAETVNPQITDAVTSAKPSTVPTAHAEELYTCRGFCHHETSVRPGPPSHEGWTPDTCLGCHAWPEIEVKEAPKATDGGPAIELTSVTDPLKPDGDIEVVITTTPGASCTIKVKLPVTGTISTKPIDKTVIADADGKATWTWYLHRHVSAGKGLFTFTVEAGDQITIEEFDFTVK